MTDHCSTTNLWMDIMHGLHNAGAGGWKLGRFPGSGYKVLFPALPYGICPIGGLPQGTSGLDSYAWTTTWLRGTVSL